MKPLFNQRRWIALAGLAALLFTQTAAALMACHQRNMMAHAGMVSSDNPCPMSQGSPTALCAQQCDPDGNKGQALDLPVALAAHIAPAGAANIAAAGAAQSFDAPGANRETGPPLFLLYQRLLLP